VPLTIFVPTKFRWSTFFSSTGLHCSSCQPRPAEGHVECHKYFAGLLIFLRSAFAILSFPAGTHEHFSSHKYFAGPLIFLCPPFTVSTISGGRHPSTSPAINILLVH
jgi:hypothetical protein